MFDGNSQKSARGGLQDKYQNQDKDNPNIAIESVSHLKQASVERSKKFSSVSKHFFTLDKKILSHQNHLYLSTFNRKFTKSNLNKRRFLRSRNTMSSKQRILMSLVSHVLKIHLLNPLLSPSFKVSLTRNSSQQSASQIVVRRYHPWLIVSIIMIHQSRKLKIRVNIR